MVKKALGVSLDEIGIGLINVGSVSFEYVASLFDDKRLQRHCAIITDSDAIMPDAKKCHIEAAKRGETRTEKLNSLYGVIDGSICFMLHTLLKLILQMNREIIAS